MKRSCTLLVTIFVLSGCGLIASQRQQEAFRQANVIREECRQRRLAGELKSYVESARCSQERMRQIIAESGHPYMDLVDLDLAYNMALAQRVDKGELSETDAKLQAAELRTRISSEEQRRAMLTYQSQLQAQQAWQNAIRMLNDNLQRQQDRDTLTAPRTMAPITCYQFGNTIQCH